MSEKRFPEQEKMQLEAGLMAAEDTVLDSVAVNYVSPLIGRIGEWKKGWLYFTEERIVCPFSPPAQGGIVIPYAAITGLKTFSDGLVPGLDVQYTAPDGEPGIGHFTMLRGRDRWLGFLSGKTGLQPDRE